jgi:transporter family-2 protein
MVPLVLLLRLPLPEAASFARPRWWFWLGGVLGVGYLTVSLVLAPRIGVAAMIAAVVAGQMLASLLLDHFGWLGLAREPATPWRLLGALLIVAGVVLLRNPLRPPEPPPAVSAALAEAPPARAGAPGPDRP